MRGGTRIFFKFVRAEVILYPSQRGTGKKWQIDIRRPNKIRLPYSKDHNYMPHAWYAIKHIDADMYVLVHAVWHPLILRQHDFCVFNCCTANQPMLMNILTNWFRPREKGTNILGKMGKIWEIILTARRISPYRYPWKTILFMWLRFSAGCDNNFCHYNLIQCSVGGM